MNGPAGSADPLDPLILPWIRERPVPGPIPGWHQDLASPLFLHLGEAWFSPSPKVLEALAAAASRVHCYPDTLCLELRRKVADYVGHGLGPEHVIIGNGSDGLIELLAKVAVAPGDAVLAPAPTFFVYGHATCLHGGQVLDSGRADQAEGFRFEASQVIAALTPNTRLVFIASPNNPTGDAVSLEEVGRILDRSSCLVVVDECYHEFHGESVVPLLLAHPRLIVLRSFSKSFALAGLRVGYALAHPRVIQMLERADLTFAVNGFAQAAALAALDDLDYYQDRFARTKAHRAGLARKLAALGLNVFPSQANILLVDYGTRHTGNVAAELARMGVYVADYHAKGRVRHCFRCSVVDDPGQDRLIAGLRTLLT